MAAPAAVDSAARGAQVPEEPAVPVRGRLVLVRQSGRLTAAEVIDYKTYTVTNPTQLPELTEFYRPQLEAYKKAAERITGLPAEKITARLVFLSGDEVVPI